MKINFKRTDLISDFSLVEAVIPGKGVITETTFALFETRKNGDIHMAIISGTDLETSAKRAMFIEEENIIEWEASKWLLNGKKLISLLKTVSQENVILEITKTNANLILDKGTYAIDMLDTADSFPIINEAKEIAFEATDKLWSTIAELAEYTANDDLRPVMNGIHLRSKDETLIVESTNAHILSKHVFRDIPFKQKIDVIIPNSIMKFIKNLKGGEVFIEEKMVTIKNGNIKYSLRLTEGGYPNVDAVIPRYENDVPRITVDVKTLIKIINRMKIAVGTKSGLLTIEASGMFAKIASRDIDYNLSAEEDLSAVISGELPKFGVKEDFFKTILNNIKSEDVTLICSEPSKAILIIDNLNSDATYIIMPMMIVN